MPQVVAQPVQVKAEPAKEIDLSKLPKQELIKALLAQLSKE